MNRFSNRAHGVRIMAVLCLCAGMAGAAEPPAQLREDRRGPETQLPLPRFVSMKAEKANVRRGPSLLHRVDWEFMHRGMPLMVTAEYGHWRKVEDRDGVGGWVHYVMLSSARTAIVEDDDLELHRLPDAEAPVVARAEKGAIVYLKGCDGGWCRVSSKRLRGWVPETALWGTRLPAEG